MNKTLHIAGSHRRSIVLLIMVFVLVFSGCAKKHQHNRTYPPDFMIPGKQKHSHVELIKKEAF